MDQMSNITALTMHREIYLVLFKQLIQKLYIYMPSLSELTQLIHIYNCQEREPMLWF